MKSEKQAADMTYEYHVEPILKPEKGSDPRERRSLEETISRIETVFRKREAAASKKAMAG